MKFNLSFRRRKARARASCLVAKIDYLDAVMRVGHAGIAMVFAGAIDLCATEAEAEALVQKTRDACDELPSLIRLRHVLAQELVTLIGAHPEACDALQDCAGLARIEYLRGLALPFYAPPPGGGDLRWPSASALFAVLGVDPDTVTPLDPPDAFLALTPLGPVSIMAPWTAAALTRVAAQSGLIDADQAFGLGLVLGGRGLHVIPGNMED